MYCFDAVNRAHPKMTDGEILGLLSNRPYKTYIEQGLLTPSDRAIKCPYRC
jgi:hypothetical protein